MGRGVASNCVNDWNHIHVLFVGVAGHSLSCPITLREGHVVIVKVSSTLDAQPRWIVANC